ncbi:uncharacterized protein LOC118477915 [Aplysia californica]|uniref:Uncharacterized protein LOC118477915 n=1 Tax=Aplysia californica TaxID=6500 RepID=A0ABM1VVN8_APLCA|nr:uncharacterized protein LOC118477915 [Aplysia californica]
MHPFRKRSDSYFVYPRFQQKNPEPPFFNGNVIPLNGRFDFGSNSNLAPRLSGRDMRAAPRHSTKRLVRAAALDENTDNTPSLGCSGNLSSESSLADRSSSLTPANERRHSFSPPRTTESHCSGDVDHSRTPTISLPSAVNPDDVTIDSVENHPLSSAANPDANGNAASNLFANLEPLLPLNDGMVNIPIDPVILDSSSPQIPSSQSSHTLSVAPQALLPGSKQNSSGNIIPRSASTGNCVSLSKPVTPREQARSPSSVSNLQPAIDLSVVGVPSASHIPSPRSPADKRRHNSVFTVADAQNFHHNYSPRKFSDTGPHLQLDPAQLPNNSRRTQSYNKQSRDYFKRNLKLKDNRVKSTLRRHAMSGYQSQLPADFIDECTLEALSKEDLLVLWKKSEIDLESKLSEVLARNRRLSMAIDYLTSEPDKAREPEEV